VVVERPKPGSIPKRFPFISDRLMKARIAQFFLKPNNLLKALSIDSLPKKQFIVLTWKMPDMIWLSGQEGI
jgi:hypothetical protein